MNISQITLYKAILTMNIALLVGCGGGSSRAAGSTTPPPDDGPASFAVPVDEFDGWEINSASVLDAGLMSSLSKDISNGEFPLLDSIAIAHQGKLVVDLTRRTQLDRFDSDVGNIDPRLHLQFSVTKVITALLVGIAIDNGDFPGVDTPYLNHFPYELETLLNSDPRKGLITLEDVLSMRLGFEWDEFNPEFDQPDNQLFSFHREQTDWSKGLFDLPMADNPGEVFVYNTIAVTSLGQAIENSQPLMLEDYVDTYLLGPLQISEIEVLRTPTNLPDLGRGAYLKSRDVAKFGQLALSDGVWNGQRVLPQGWIADVTTNRTELMWANPDAFSWQITGMGYQWWLGTFSHEGTAYDSFAARGFGLQLLMVIPDLELVIAINSHGWDEPDDEEALFRLISEYIIPAAVDA